VGLTSEESRFDSRQRQEIFLYHTMSRPVLRLTQNLIQWVLGTLFPVVKRPRLEADDSPPYSLRSRMVEL
jgi:hypothetical protein